MAREERFLCLSVLVTLLPLICNSTTLDANHLQNMCYIKDDKVLAPTKNKEITGPCSSWKKTCCSSDDSKEIANGERVTFDVCGRKMSDKCRRHFERKTCFQDCSPYIGPWMLNRTEIRRNTKFQFVPLCRSACEEWWNDCKADFAENETWPPDGYDEYDDGKCETMEAKYKDSTYFCEHVFGPFEFLVVNDNDMCMTLFDDHYNNKFVAIYYSEQVEKIGTGSLYPNQANMTFISEKLKDRTLDSTGAPEAKFLILCFFLGGIIATLGFVVGCFLLAKCRPELPQSVSRTSLIDDQRDEEAGDETMALN